MFRLSPSDTSPAFFRRRGVRLQDDASPADDLPASHPFLSMVELDADTMAALSFAIGCPIGPQDMPAVPAEAQDADGDFAALSERDAADDSSSGWSDAPIVSLVERLLVQAAKRWFGLRQQWLRHGARETAEPAQALDIGFCLCSSRSGPPLAALA